MVSRGPSRRTLVGVTAAALAAAMILPRVGIDYGADGDARRSAAAALRLASRGEYTPSRLPGSPVFESVLAVIVPWGGHTAANLFVVASYVMSVLAFHRLARARPHGMVWTALFGLTPVILLNGATTMDYVPGLALLLWSYVMLRADNLPAAGALMALAIGVRLTNGLFLVPLASFLVLRGATLPRTAAFVAATAAAGLVTYAPVIASAGARALTLPPQLATPLDYAVVTASRFIALLGLPAVAALAALMAVHRRRAAATWRRQVRRLSPEFAVEMTAIILFSGVFLLHSDERDYLLPIIPFVFLHVARWLPARRVSIVLACVLVPAIVSIDPRPGARLLRLGIIAGDLQKRSELTSLRADLGCFDEADRAIILTGMGPALTHENAALEHVDLGRLPFLSSATGVDEPENIHRLRGRDVFLVYDLSVENRQGALLAGYRVFSLFDRPDLAGNGGAVLTEPLDPGALCRDR